MILCFVEKDADWSLGREIFTTPGFGSRSKKFGKNCSRLQRKLITILTWLLKDSRQDRTFKHATHLNEKGVDDTTAIQGYDAKIKWKTNENPKTASLVVWYWLLNKTSRYLFTGSSWVDQEVLARAISSSWFTMKACNFSSHWMDTLSQMILQRSFLPLLELQIFGMDGMALHSAMNFTACPKSKEGISGTEQWTQHNKVQTRKAQVVDYRWGVWLVLISYTTSIASCKISLGRKVLIQDLVESAYLPLISISFNLSARTMFLPYHQTCILGLHGSLWE